MKFEHCHQKYSLNYSNIIWKSHANTNYFKNFPWNTHTIIAFKYMLYRRKPYQQSTYIHIYSQLSMRIWIHSVTFRTSWDLQITQRRRHRKEREQKTHNEKEETSVYRLPKIPYNQRRKFPIWFLQSNCKIKFLMKCMLLVIFIIIIIDQYMYLSMKF